MDRPQLLGLCATLNVAQAWLDETGRHAAARHLNASVVSLHRSERWTRKELTEMGAAQAWLVVQLCEERGRRPFRG